MNNRPEYEALDNQGHPYMREARVIHELPVNSRRAALHKALAKISRECGLTECDPLYFGLPVYHAFGLTLSEASSHTHSELLLMQSGDLSLDYVD